MATKAKKTPAASVARKKTRDDKVGLLVYVDPKLRSTVHALARRNRLTTQDFLEALLGAVIKKAGTNARFPFDFSAALNYEERARDARRRAITDFAKRILDA